MALCNVRRCCTDLACQQADNQLQGFGSKLCAKYDLTPYRITEVRTQTALVEHVDTLKSKPVAFSKMKRCYPRLQYLDLSFESSTSSTSSDDNPQNVVQISRIPIFKGSNLQSSLDSQIMQNTRDSLLTQGTSQPVQESKPVQVPIPSIEIQASVPDKIPLDSGRRPQRTRRLPAHLQPYYTNI